MALMKLIVKLVKCWVIFQTYVTTFPEGKPYRYLQIYDQFFAGHRPEAWPGLMWLSHSFMAMSYGEQLERSSRYWASFES